MKIEYKKLTEITPYENNPRKNDEAVEYVANSIKEFGFKVPIIIDKDGVIIAGHTRYKAAKQLNMDEIPTIKADDLTDEQVKAFRLADNRVGEIATWDFGKLEIELDDIIEIDMSDFDLNMIDDSFSLLDDAGFDAEQEESGLFSISFIIPKEHEIAVKGYLSVNGKNKLVDMIVEECEGYSYGTSS